VTLLPLLATLAAAPLPRAASPADVAVFIPHLDNLTALAAWGEKAGARSVLLRPGTWTSEFGAFFFVDPTRADSLTAAGLYPKGDATVSRIGDGRLTCAALADVALFRRRSDERLKLLGEVEHKSERGVEWALARLEKTLRAGYAIKGRYGCSFAGPARVEALATEAGARVQSPSPTAGWPSAGTVWVKAPQGSIALRATPTDLVAEAKPSRSLAADLAAAGPSPYAALAPSGLLFARARIKAAAVAPWAHTLVASLGSVCPACGAPDVSADVDALAALFTGNVLLRVDRAQVKGTLRSAAERYFSARHAYLFELSTPADALPVVAHLAQTLGAKTDGDAFALGVPGGVLRFGIRESHFFLANDEAALQRIATATSAPAATQGHGLEAWLDPRLAAQALGQIPLLDILGSSELASLFAVGTEVGPLLGITDSVSASADAPSRITLTWRLSAGASPE